MAKMPRMPLKHITAWRGRPESMTALRQVYKPGRIVKWAGFTSCTTRIDNAAYMANWADGCVLELTLTDAVCIAELSCYPHEDEILLPPNTTFIVNPKTKVEDITAGNGQTYMVKIIQMIQVEADGLQVIS